MFKTAVELLLSGNFICGQTHHKAFAYLGDEQNFEEVETYLLKIGRKLKITETGSAFYLGYSDLTSPVSRQQVAKEFSIFRANLRPMIEFIQLVMNSNKTDMPLSVGDIISVSKVINQVESNELVRDIANSIVRTSNIKAGKDTTDKVTNIFAFMEKHSLLVLGNKLDKIYAVTGVVDYVYEVLRYVDEREQILDKVDDEDAGDLYSQRGLF